MDIVELTGSAPVPHPAATTLISPDERVDLTVVLGRGQQLVPDPAAPLTRRQLAESYGADPAARDRLVAHAVAAGMKLVGADLATRLVELTGTAAQAQAAFGTDLARAGDDRVQTSPVMLPSDVAADVVAVLGLDTRDAARHQTRRHAQAVTDAAYTPLQLAADYAFPAADGAGQVVAIIELGGGYETADLKAYAKAVGVSKPHVTAVSVQGAKNVPGGDPNGADGEVCLDVEVVGTVVPAAHIRVYFAPNTDAGFVAAVSQATHDSAGVTVMSISWGSAESTWTTASTTAFDAALADAAALGVTVCVAAGDGGSSDGQSDGSPHVDFPASSPHALGCGGTSRPVSGVEVVWNDGAGGGAGGGGISAVFPVPTFQTGLLADGAPLTGRGVPDVAADADPETGSKVRIDGSDTVIGGTSAAAPLWAGLIARLQTGGSPRWLTPLLYGLPAGTLHDVTSGSNGAYTATEGWDPCTGLGTPDGTAIAAGLPTVAVGAPAGSDAGPGETAAAES
jgi:kumamolisin